MNNFNAYLEIEFYDWVDRKLQEMADMELYETETYDWVDRRLQEMADAEFEFSELFSDTEDLTDAEEDINHFTYHDIREYHRFRTLERKFICSLH